MPIEYGSNLPKVKVMNRVTIRKMIYHYGPLLRLDIAKRLSLTLPTITTNVNEMIAQGVVRDQELSTQEGSRVGRRANLVDIVPASKFFIGAEMRKDSCRLCITDYRGNIVHSVADTASLPDYNQNLARVCSMITQALGSDIAVKSGIAGIGVSVPGVVDTEAGKLIAHRQYGWFDKDIRAEIRSKTDYAGTISVGNDACTRAMAMQLFERDLLNGVSAFAYLFIARGISCPFILNTSNFECRPLGLGELGYMIIDADRPVDSIGMPGNLSSLSGERAIIDRCHEAMIAGNTPILTDLCGNLDRPTFSQVLAAQLAGETIVQEILASSISSLGIAVCNVCNFIQPEYFFIDARLFESKENRQLFLETVDKHLMVPSNLLPHFVFVEADEFRGAHSAAGYAIRAELDRYDD